MDGTFGEGVLAPNVIVMNVELDSESLLLIRPELEDAKLGELAVVMLTWEVADPVMVGALVERVAAGLECEAVNSDTSLEIADRAALEPLTGTVIDMLEGAVVIEGTAEPETSYGEGEKVGNPGTELELLLARGLIILGDDEEP